MSDKEYDEFWNVLAPDIKNLSENAIESSNLASRIANAQTMDELEPLLKDLGTLQQKNINAEFLRQDKELKRRLDPELYDKIYNPTFFEIDGLRK
jgi:hypothetical protein